MGTRHNDPGRLYLGYHPRRSCGDWHVVGCHQQRHQEPRQEAVQGQLLSGFAGSGVTWTPNRRGRVWYSPRRESLPVFHHKGPKDMNASEPGVLLFSASVLLCFRGNGYFIPKKKKNKK